jgi:hypothetical protein
MGLRPHVTAYVPRAKLAIQAIMKTRHKTKTSSCRIEAKSLTLGDLISATYSACGEQQAPKILQLAIDSHLVQFKRAHLS